MISRPRWVAECRLMRSVFPQFEPFSANGTVGFRGKLQGPRTGRIYTVTVRASAQLYPAYEALVYMAPHPEEHHWRIPDGVGRGHLCYLRDEKPWNPQCGTFANVLLVAVKYVAEFD